MCNKSQDYILNFCVKGVIIVTTEISRLQILQIEYASKMFMEEKT